MSATETGRALPAPGSIAADFTLPDTHGTPVTLSDLRGGPVLLVFYPFAFSRVCHGELTQFSAHREAFDAAGTEVLAISCDPMHSLRAWQEQEDFDLTLLSDFWPHGQVSSGYGVFNAAAGHPGRGSVLIDASGTVVWSTLSPAGQARSVPEHVEALAAVAAS